METDISWICYIELNKVKLVVYMLFWLKHQLRNMLTGNIWFNTILNDFGFARNAPTKLAENINFLLSALWVLILLPIFLILQPEESPYSLKVQLLPKYNIWVNRSKLTTLLQDSMGQTDNAPLFLLRKLIPVVFSWEELAFSRG